FFVIFLSERNSGHLFVTFLSASGVVASILVGLFHIYRERRLLKRVKEVVVQLARGKIPVFTPSDMDDEHRDLDRSLEKLVENLRSLTRFARSMASGDFTGRYEKLSADDEIGEALLSLKESLIGSHKESESRQQEEEHRTWAAHGLAKFSKLFREAEDDLQELSAELMRELVAYTGADVGALFISREKEGQSSELYVAGSYAFDRQKFIHQSFEFGEGLVGRAAMEKDLIFVTDLPPGYMKIRSGLGEDVPSSLLLIPVILDNIVLGVIELASLGEFPAYQTGFLQQLADALASTLAKVKANLQNRELFEQSRKQAEELASQEQEYIRREESLLREIEQLKKRT
ncbi:MAG: GAF domain-containing protein, partial [Bacteroidetes bacterium]|nr:GAF domain-containing protein [Bacteroidota bacterium]